MTLETTYITREMFGGENLAYRVFTTLWIQLELYQAVYWTLLINLVFTAGYLLFDPMDRVALVSVILSIVGLRVLPYFYERKAREFINKWVLWFAPDEATFKQYLREFRLDGSIPF